MVRVHKMCCCVLATLRNYSSVNLHYSKTVPNPARATAPNYSSVNLHYSKTPFRLSNDIVMNYSSVILHYSKTPNIANTFVTGTIVV